MGTLPAGQLLNHYRIVEKIGEGGMGEVYKAEDTKLGRIVALKLLPTEAKEESNARRRLLREARSASALNHPNIITIYSIEESDKTDFIVMEYVEGETLKSVIQSGALKISQLADLGAQVAEGLSAAHAAGLMHRDIKPSNILITPLGQAKILDFGLAKTVEVTDQDLSGENTMSRLTKTGMIVGTVSYMSPEQTRGEVLDARTDIFSLGCVLYEAATGKVPFSGPSVLSVLHEIATADPASPSAVSTRVPQGWDVILKRALAKNRDERYSSAAEVARALRGMTFADRYQILRELGRGGMGIVYLARDPMLERDVAIKVMTPELLSPEAIERFKREARVVAGMDHPAIVGVYDIGENNGSLFFIMPYVEGTNLRSFLKEGSLSLGDVIDIGTQVAEALEYSHSKGVVHRDIKPENILVTRLDTEGVRVRVTDFGLAMATAHSHLTKTGTLVGTISYLSPEQISQRDLDGRSDIYALGIVLYECLTGKTPYAGEIQSVLYRIAHEIPQSPRALGAEIPEGVEEIVMRCLEKDPQQRQQKAKEVADGLMRQRSKLHDSERIQKLSTIHRASTVAQRPVQSRMIGREKEFAEMQRRLNSALQGECQFVVVAGEAGIGKSRLLDELENLAKARKLRVLHSRFVEQDQAFPYQGFCEAIQEYFSLKMASTTSGPVDFSDLAPDLISLFPVLAEVEEISGGHKMPSAGEAQRSQDRTYIFDLLARSFVRIGSGKPLVIFLEDLHNADISLEALQYMVRRLGSTPTLIVGTYRTTEVDKHHPVARMIKGFHGDRRFLQMPLEPFSSAEHRSFLETLVGSAEMEQEFVEKLYEATEGNPHFTKELVRSLIDSGRIIKNQTGSWDLSGETALSSEALPPTIQETVEKRIERLPKEWRDVLSIASIPGRTFEFRDLKLLSEDGGELEDIVDGLISSGFIEEERGSRGDVFTFSSGILRDVLYAEVPRRKKRKYHREYAEQLEKRASGRLEQVYPQLLHHYAEGDVPEKVIEFGMLQMKKSLDALSAEDALRSGKIVLEFIQGENDVAPIIEAEVRLLIARAHRIGGSYGDALTELQSAIEMYERAGQKEQILSALFEATEVAWEGRKIDEAKHWVEKGLDLARSAQQKEILIKLLSLAATVTGMRGEHDTARQYLEEAARIKPEAKEKEDKISDGGTLSVALPNPIGFLHPVKTKIEEEAEVISGVFDTILRMNEQGHVTAHLCENWDVLEKGKSFLFTLRKNIYMHDGELLTAVRMKSCIEQSIRMNPDHIPAAFATLRGISQFLEGSSDSVEGLVAISEETIRMDLQEPLPIYPALLTDPTTSIVYEKDSHLVGTGPFQLTEFNARSVVLTKNQNYWKNSPHLDQVHFRCGLSSAEIAAGIRSGSFDIGSNLLPDDLEKILQDRQFRAGLAETSKKNVYFILFNNQGPLSKIPEVRRALNGVVRVDDLVRATLGRFAQPAHGLFPPGILGHDAGRRPRQAIFQENAAEILRTAGVTLPIRLKAAVHPILQDRYKSITEELFKAWAELGVEISIETTSMKSYLESYKRKEGLDLMIGRYNTDYDDPDNFTFFLFHSKTGLYNFYSSEELDRMMEDARTENDPLVREKLYRKIENYLMDSDCLLPLFHDIDYRVAGARVRGLTLYGSRPYVRYEEVGKAEVAAPSVKKAAGGIIYVPFVNELYSIDPSLAKSLQQAEISAAVFETLTRELGQAQVSSGLAAEFSVEEGGKRFHFRLRDDVRFHNGRRLTARDVRYTFEYILQNPQSYCRWMLTPIRGGKALASGQATELEGFKILSATEFLIYLDQPLSLFPAFLAYPGIGIFPEGTRQFNGSWRDGCVGTGPFRVVSFDPGRRLELEANPDYWRKGYPKSEGLVFTFGVSPHEILAGFRTGRYSVVGELYPSDVDALRHEPEFASGYKDTPRLCTYYVALNLTKSPLSEEAIRHRLLRDIDVETLVRRTLGRLAIPAQGLIPPGLLGYEPRKRRSSGSPKKSDPSQNIELLCANHTLFDGPYAAFTKELFRAFSDNGFTIRTTETKAEHSKYPVIAGTVDLVMTRWIGDYTDPDTFFSGLLHSERGLVAPLCSTPDMDQLIDRGRRETHPQLRHEIYQQAEQMIVERAIMFPLFHEQTYRFVRPEVEGFELRFTSTQVVDYEKLSIRR